MTSADRPARAWGRITTTALLLGVVHAFVDAASGFIIFRDVGSGALERSMVLALVVTYNSLAFGGQVPVGLVADRLRAYRGTAVLGIVLAAAALLVAPLSALAAVVAVGIGNACYHIGAGAFVLKHSRDRSTESGVFVGPGAIGLFTGIWLGGHDLPARGAIALLLALSVLLVLRVLRPPAQEPPSLPRIRTGAAALAVLCAVCLFGSVTVRALVGGTVSGSWRGVSVTVMLLLALAACFGKMLGGFVGDRLGWLKTSVAALLLSAPLISYLSSIAAAAVVGMLLFQITMPVTLKAMHHLLPGRPGLAFGIPCLALLFGALPGLLGARMLPSWPLVLGAMALSTAIVALGLHLLVRAGASGGPGSGILGGGARP